MSQIDLQSSECSGEKDFFNHNKIDHYSSMNFAFSFNLDGLQFNMSQEQFVYKNRIKLFDPSLNSAARYSPPPPSVEVNSSTPFNAILNYNETQHQTSENVITSAPEIQNNCIAYNNVILLPSLPNNANHIEDASVEFVRNGRDTQYRYVVASDSRLLNTFVRSSNIDGTQNASNTEEAFVEQTSSPHMITVPDSGENNSLTNSNGNHLNIYSADGCEIGQLEQNQIPELLHEKSNEPEILMQTADGQLYRQVQNIYVNNGQTIYSSEFIPTIVPDANTLTDIGYLDPNQFHQNIHTNCAPYQLQSNFVDNTTQTDGSMNNLQNQPQVELIYDNNSKINEESNYTEVDQNHFALPNNSTHNLMHSNRDQQRSTMSPLCK